MRRIASDRYSNFFFFFNFTAFVSTEEELCAGKIVRWGFKKTKSRQTKCD